MVHPVPGEKGQVKARGERRGTLADIVMLSGYLVLHSLYLLRSSGMDVRSTEYAWLPLSVAIRTARTPYSSPRPQPPARASV